MEGNKANLFIVGAMKAGTTTFIDLISQHSQIYVSPIKEPHYFIRELPETLYEPSRFFSLEHYLKEDFPKPLHIAKVETEKQYSQLFSNADQEVFKVDGSTAYLHAEESARLIHDYQPNAKIIILVRNPLKRAYSHFNMNLGKGREKRSFENAMVDEIELYNRNALPWHSYLAMSFYKNAIERYTNLFEDVLVLNFEEFISNQDAVLLKVTDFLKLPPFRKLDIIHKNKSRSLRFQPLFYFLKRLGLKDYFSNFFSSNFRQWLFVKLSKKTKKSIKLSSETSMKLEEIFNKESV